MESSTPPTLCGLKWLRSKQPSRLPTSGSVLRIADIFSGCGGFSLGVLEACRSHDIAVAVRYALDSDRDASYTYCKNFGAICKQFECDRVERIFGANLESKLAPREKQLRSAVGPIDLLVAGPPCQGHSDLNNHSRRLDRRNSLYARVARAVEVLCPRVVIVENVVGVVNDRGRVVSRATNHLELNGFTVVPLYIDARNMGVPQSRRRHFLVAFAEELREKWHDLPKYRATGWTVGDVICGLEDEPKTIGTVFTTPSRSTSENRRRIANLFQNGAYELSDSQRPSCHRDYEHTYKAVYGRLRWNGEANTITGGFGSMGQGRYVHPKRRRLITPHEAARLQGFPDWFSFEGIKSRGSLQSMIGNAVIPRVAAFLVQHLLKCEILRPINQADSSNLRSAFVPPRRLAA